jgi:hypothetical protein
MNIPAPKIGALPIGFSKQNGDFFVNGSNNFYETVITYG